MEAPISVQFDVLSVTCIDFRILKASYRFAKKLNKKNYNWKYFVQFRTTAGRDCEMLFYTIKMQMFAQPGNKHLADVESASTFKVNAGLPDKAKKIMGHRFCQIAFWHNQGVLVSHFQDTVLQDTIAPNVDYGKFKDKFDISINDNWLPLGKKK